MTEPASNALNPERHVMVEEQIESRGVVDERVLEAMRTVPRHELVPHEVASCAYLDMPLPIGGGKTISQPYIVALMTELARVEPGDRVLEVGTGSGYQAAVLAELGAEVWSIEIDPRLLQLAQEALPRLGYGAVRLRLGDGYHGWPEEAPFDAIIVTAASPHIPAPLREQLAIGGRMVIPVGDHHQELLVITRTSAHEYHQENVIPVQFVPLTGHARSD
jgi:protein-L-isoaspartate(D-aspartate) O-methyltransferase